MLSTKHFVVLCWLSYAVLPLTSRGSNHTNTINHIWPPCGISQDHTLLCKSKTATMKSWCSRAGCLHVPLPPFHVRRFLTSRSWPSTAQRCSLTTGCAPGQVSWEPGPLVQTRQGPWALGGPQPPTPHGNASMCLSRPWTGDSYFMQNGHQSKHIFTSVHM